MHQFLECQRIRVAHVARNTIPRLVVGTVAYRVLWMLIAPFIKGLVVFVSNVLYKALGLFTVLILFPRIVLVIETVAQKYSSSWIRTMHTCASATNCTNSFHGYCAIFGFYTPCQRTRRTLWFLLSREEWWYKWAIQQYAEWYMEYGLLPNHTPNPTFCSA